ncbi:MAG: BamA/TamA family outer membrane protein [Armatimonadetes bacterium]|nr:BamA/TamA family outer membrane protein [Armatimonadota bacterium]MDE2207283.1 BamA/TamA family outer membrane protein [Armatimonadota bacterium]
MNWFSKRSAAASSTVVLPVAALLLSVGAAATASPTHPVSHKHSPGAKPTAAPLGPAWSWKQFSKATQPAPQGALVQNPAKPPSPAKPDTPPPAAPQTSLPTVPQAGATPKIGEIDVTGNKTLSSAFIIAASGHKVGDPCTDETLSEMQTNIYRTGFFGFHSADPADAVKVSSQENNPPNGFCKVLIEVDENPTIKAVNITGSGPIKPEEVRSLLHIDLTHGAVYSEDQLGRDLQDIQDLYNKRGYLMAPAQDTGPDPKNPSILNVSLVVARVAEIKITGNHKTRSRVITREMHTKQGDYFNQFTLDRDHARLLNLDLFDDVIPAVRNLGPGRVGVALSVHEKRTGTVNVGVGYSSRSQLIGFAELAENNFRGLGEAVSLRWDTGGISNKSSVELGFTEPWIDKRHTSLNVQVYDRTVYRFANTIQNALPAPSGSLSTSDHYNEQRLGSTITVSRPFHSDYRAAVTVRGENVRTDALSLSPINADIVQNGPIYSLAGSIIHNTRDLDLDPVEGEYQTASLEFGHARLSPVNPIITNGVFGDVNFVKLSLDQREYFSLTGPRPANKPEEDKSAIAVRMLAGTAAGKLPFFEQYFLGGADSLRGYREDRFWGTNMVLGSVEFRQPIARRLKGVLFFDVGDAWGGQYANVNLSGFAQGQFKLHPAIGFGVRVGTPLGPVRLDFGFGDEGGRTHFSIGNVF